MCQLYAMNSSSPVSVEAALSTFTARGGRTGDHVDGWGVVFHESCGSRVFIDPQRAVDSALASFICRSPIRATTVLAHVRKATHGRPALTNCHPFQREWRGRSWSFCHNGKLLDYAPALDGPYRPVGETDSERAFCWILQQLDRRLPRPSAPHWRDVAPLLAELATEVGRHGEFNFTLTDGNALYALGATRLAWQHQRMNSASSPAGQHHQVHIATEPLDSSAGWYSFAPGELRIFERGQAVWSRRLYLPAPERQRVSQPDMPQALAA